MRCKSEWHVSTIGVRTVVLVGAALIFSCSQEVATSEAVGQTAQAATAFTWKGHTWDLTSGGMAGVAEGDPKNVSIDANGYLHLKITNTAGTWTAAELFTTDKLGFGT